MFLKSASLFLSWIKAGRLGFDNWQGRTYARVSEAQTGSGTHLISKRIYKREFFPRVEGWGGAELSRFEAKFLSPCN